MPAYPDITPEWLKSKMDPSVLDSTFTKVIRALAQAIGADDPASQVMGVTAGLDMSKASRLARAAEQGFDTSRELYHGTTNDFPSFKGRTIYLTDKPEIADIYAEAEGRHKALLNRNAGPNVMPVYARAKKPLVVSDLGPDGTGGWSGDNMASKLGVENPGTGTFLHEEARRQGYDLIEIRDMSDLGGRQTQFIPLKPEYVRSRFAAFDPAKISHSDLLATLGGVTTAGSLMGESD